MSESIHAEKMRQKYPWPEPNPAEEIETLRTLLVEEGKVGWRGKSDEIVQYLKKRHPAAYEAFSQEYRRTILKRYEHSPYLDEKKKVLSGSEDGEIHLRKLRGLRNTMIKFKLGYGGYAMGMLFGKAKNRYPEAYKALREELEDH